MRVVIVCSCNVISDQQVRSVTAEHAVRGTSEVYRCLGCSAACGRCARTIRNIMEEVHAGMARTETASPSICAAPEPPSLPVTGCPAAHECEEEEKPAGEWLVLAAAS